MASSRAVIELSNFWSNVMEGMTARECASRNVKCVLMAWKTVISLWKNVLYVNTCVLSLVVENDDVVKPCGGVDPDPDAGD